MDKSHWRKKFKEKIGTLDEEHRRLQSLILEEKVLSYMANQKGLWTLFFPMNDEPNLLNLFRRCRHIRWAFPKVISKNDMDFYQISSLDTPVEQGCPVSTREINGCVVPGIAYDKNGTRLGRGAGHYDRFLEGFEGLKLGVTFNEGFTDEVLPREYHDQIMDIIASPKKWIELTNEVENEF